jgi:hypothetical protein
MAYCNSDLLEQKWFTWLLASATPELEPFRNHGLLFSKPDIHVHKDGVALYKNGKPLFDPSSPLKHHCLPFETPVYFSTCDGEIVDFFIIQHSVRFVNTASLKSLSEAFPIIGKPSEKIVAELEQEEYIQEIPEQEAWHALLFDIKQMCSGIAQKFKPNGEEEHLELIHEALLQVLQKLKNKKLKYMPGKAPVFNLLTTTIYRCLYSVMNKRKHIKEGQYKLGAAIQNGRAPANCRSFRINKQGLD